MRISVLAVVCLAVLVAGCGGLAGEDSQSDGTGTAVTADPDADDEVVVSLAEHRRVLRGAGSFTYVRTLNFTYESQGFTDDQVDVVSVNLTSGRAMHVDVPAGGDTRRTYVAANGTSYEQLRDGYVVHQSPRVNGTRYLDHRLGDGWDADQLSRVGTTTIDGVQVTEYEIEVPSLPGAAGTQGNVERYEGRVYVTESGLVKRRWMNVTIEQDGERVRITDRITYRDVGETRVREPDWVRGEPLAVVGE